MTDELGNITALSGIRILEAGEGIAGPYAASMLGDMGADVIKVERPEGDWARTSGRPIGDTFSGCFLAVNRNKRNLGLDLRRPTARPVALRLVEKSDVVIANFRPGVMDRLGLGFEDCVRVNPRIIYCTISAYGETGEHSMLPGSDTVLQAFSGIMELTGEQDRAPLRVGFPLIDTTSALLAVQGILTALYARTETSAGVKLELSLLNTALTLQALPLTDYLIDGTRPQRIGNQNAALAPAGAFLTADNRHLTIVTLRDQHWRSLCETLERPELADEPRFADNAMRVAHRTELNKILASLFEQRDQETWLELLRTADIPCSPVNTFDDIVGNGDLMATAPIHTFALPDGREVRTVANPLRIDGRFPSVRRGPAVAGQHTGRILEELGFDRTEIATMVEDGAAHLSSQ